MYAPLPSMEKYRTLYSVVNFVDDGGGERKLPLALLSLRAHRLGQSCVHVMFPRAAPSPGPFGLDSALLSDETFAQVWCGFFFAPKLV